MRMPDKLPIPIHNLNPLADKRAKSQRVGCQTTAVHLIPAHLLNGDGVSGQVPFIPNPRMPEGKGSEKRMAIGNLQRIV
jgi:hypothetical protein